MLCNQDLLILLEWNSEVIVECAMDDPSQPPYFLVLGVKGHRDHIMRGRQHNLCFSVWECIYTAMWARRLLYILCTLHSSLEIITMQLDRLLLYCQQDQRNRLPSVFRPSVREPVDALCRDDMDMPKAP